MLSEVSVDVGARDSPNQLPRLRNHGFPSFVVSLRLLFAVILTVDDVAQDSLELLDKLDQIVRKLALVLVAISDDLVLDQSDVVLDFWQQAAAKDALVEEEFLQNAIDANQVANDFEVQIFEAVFVCLLERKILERTQELWAVLQDARFGEVQLVDAQIDLNAAGLIELLHVETCELMQDAQNTLQ